MGEARRRGEAGDKKPTLRPPKIGGRKLRVANSKLHQNERVAKPKTSHCKWRQPSMQQDVALKRPSEKFNFAHDRMNTGPCWTQ